MKTRVEVHLDRDLSKWLNDLAKRPGSSKSAIMGDALKAYLERGATLNIDPAVRTRMDKLSRMGDRLERNQEILLETMAMYVEHDLGITGMLPESERAVARAIGKERFAKFVEHIGQRLAKGTTLARDLASEVEVDIAAGDAEAAVTVGKKPH